ncbi:MAG: tetratricopeptide repeat protein, partial [Methyloceanibacter sp.]
MAGVIARDRGPRAALALRRLDAARQLGAHELDRFAALAESRRLDGDTMRYIVAFNGMVGGLQIADLRKTLADELAASHRTANLDVLLALLEQELPSRMANLGWVLEQELPSRSEIEAAVQQGRLATIKPDLIGEAAIVEAFSGQPSKEAEGPVAVRRAYDLGQEAAAHVLVRVVQDFAYALEDKSATKAEKAAGQMVMTWLLTLGRNLKDPVQMIALVAALPFETIILREAAVELTQRLADLFRQEAEANNAPGAVSNAAAWSSNLALRLRALGRREKALDAAEEGVRLYRALAAADPGAVTPDLVKSLNNLAGTLGDLGRHDEALAAAEEAESLYRAQVEADLSPGLAYMLSNLEQYGEGLGVDVEEVRLLRPLIEAGSTPDPIGSLSARAGMLSALGRHEEALNAAKAAVSAYRVGVQAHPEFSTPGLAASLNNLAVALGSLERLEEALAAAREAVSLRRDLAAARPDAFTPDLGTSLKTLAVMLRQRGRREEALAAADEAVSIYRALAEARPDAFTEDLARSLWFLGGLQKERNPELALSTLREAIELLTPILVANPAAIADVMRGIMQDFLSQSMALGLQDLSEADDAMVWRVRKVFEQLKSLGEQS